MAANSSFKQQCPSCEDNVLIKDAKLVGKKIDCPKCKFRFTVEEPKATSDDYEDVTDEAEGKTAKKPAAKVGAKTVKGVKETLKDAKEPAKTETNGKSAPAKKKAPGKKEEADEGDGETKKKGFKKKGEKSGKSTKIYVGAGLAGVAVLLLGGAAYFLFGDSKPNKPGPKKSSTLVKNTPGAPGAPPEPGDDAPKPPVPVNKNGPDLADPSNHLLPDVDLVLDLKISEILTTVVGKALFEPPLAVDPKEVLGFSAIPVDEMDRLILSGNSKSEWEVKVVRTNKPIKLDALKSELKLASAPPIREQAYFLFPHSDSSDGAMPGKPKGPVTWAMRLHDSQTLIFGDVEPMKKFLEVDGRPPIRDQGPRPGAPGMPPRPPMPMPPGAGAPGNKPADTSKPYLTIDPQFKVILDRLDVRQPRLATFAAEGLTNLKKHPVFGSWAPVVEMMLGNPKLERLGISLNADTGVGATVVVECKTVEDAKKLDAKIPDLLTMAESWVVANEKIAVHRKRANPNRPGPPQTTTPAPAENPSVPSLTLDESKQIENVVQVTAHLSVPAFALLNLKYLVPARTKQRGEAEMVGRQPTPHDLAAAGRAYADKKKAFPRGTYDRKIPVARSGRPWYPEQRVSWMADLLPFLNYPDVRIDYDRSWNDPENLNASMTLIPYFIVPSYPAESRYLARPEGAAAVTHYVGIAGVGLDAARYKPDDPRCGIFGYDRVTPLSDVGDNTILMIQLPKPPGGIVGPWLEGGGSTVRGVPEKNSARPFVSDQGNGKAGTYALMADGSVRFIAGNVSDEVFKALSVIKKDKIPDLDSLAPKVPPPEKKSEMKATAPPEGK